MRKILPILLLLAMPVLLGNHAKAGLRPGFQKPFKLPEGITEDNVQPNTVIVKLREDLSAYGGVRSISHPNLTEAIQVLGISSIEKRFPDELPPLKGQTDKYGNPFVDLSRIYTVQYTSSANIEAAVNILQNTRIFEYAVPLYLREKTLIPNDPEAASPGGLQAHLAEINMYDAWDISTGDTNVVIAVVDDGFDLDHPDMAGQYYRNYGEIPNNLIDDDNDGYVDNFIGIDLAGADFNNFIPDGDPSAVGPNTDHGVHVSGIAGAATNNSTAGAGTGYNCRIMPVKATADNDTRSGGNGFISFGYDGIRFAAATGADIINCSWGGGGDSPFEQEIIDYAIVNKGAIVVAAAGNNSSTSDFYPASYPGVVSVASIAGNNSRHNFSNYNYNVDVGAPGQGIYSNIWNNTYGSRTGTSMASPVVAGVLGLIKSQFPNEDNHQIATRLRNSSKYPYNTGFNRFSSVFGRLGHGVIDAHKALLGATPGFELVEYDLNDPTDGIVSGGDTVQLTFTLKNILGASPASTMAFVMGGGLSVASRNAMTNVSSDTAFIGSIPSQTEMSTVNQPLSFVLAPNSSTNINLDIILAVTDSANSFYQLFYISERINKTYIDIKVNRAWTSLTSRGRIGYDSDGASDLGLGFNYDKGNMLYECALMIGNGNGQVSNTARSTSGATRFSDHFFPVEPVQISTFDKVSDFDLIGKMDDRFAPNPLGLDIQYRSFAWSDSGHDNYVLFTYDVVNSSANTYDSIHIGMYADWDNSPGGSGDWAKYDSARNMGYIQDIRDTNGLHAAIKIINPSNMNYYAIQNDHENNPHIGVYDGFDDWEKWYTLSNGISKPTAGLDSADGVDVSFVIADGPYQMAPGDTVSVTFALLGGRDVAEINATADSSEQRYDSTDFTLVSAKELESVRSLGAKIYPNPSNGAITVALEGNKSQNPISLRIYSLQGALVEEVNNTIQRTFQFENLNNGMYVIEIQQEGRYFIDRLIIE